MKITCVASGSSGNCYIVNDEGHMLCLDCGQKIQWNQVQRACDFRIHELDGVIYTHQHSDHFGHISDFVKRGIDCYGGPELAEIDSRVQTGPGARTRLLKKRWRLFHWKVPHTDGDGSECPCYAFYIITPSTHKIVYMTDFLYSPYTFKTLSVNTLLIACNHDDDIDSEHMGEKFRHTVSGHSSLSTVDEIVRVNKTDSLRNIILCHLSRENATPTKMVGKIAETAGPDINVFVAAKNSTFYLN